MLLLHNREAIYLPESLLSLSGSAGFLLPHIRARSNGAAFLSWLLGSQTGELVWENQFQGEAEWFFLTARLFWIKMCLQRKVTRKQSSTPPVKTYALTHIHYICACTHTHTHMHAKGQITSQPQTDHSFHLGFRHTPKPWAAPPSLSDSSTPQTFNIICTLGVRKNSKGLLKFLSGNTFLMCWVLLKINGPQS